MILAIALAVTIREKPVACGIRDCYQDTMTFGERLRAWRLGLNKTQRQAAKAAGIGQSVWAELEADAVKRIGLDVARRVVAVTGGCLSLEDFPRGKGRRVKPLAPESGTNVGEQAKSA